MTPFKPMAAVLICASLAACASKRPIVDTKGVDMARYEQDLSECQAYAGQVDTAGRTGRSAVGGAALGAAIGAIVGDSKTVARSAGVGGVVGGARGASRATGEQDAVVKNCLRGRGYRVLN